MSQEIEIKKLLDGEVPVIDGEKDNFWRFYDKDISGNSGLNTGSNPGEEFDPANRYDPRINIAWSEDAIYVFIEVKDDDVNETPGWVEGDYMAFGFDFNNDGDNANFSDDGMIMMTPNAAIGELNGRSGQDFGGAWVLPDGTEYASRVTEDGSNFRFYHEFKFPLWDGLDVLTLDKTIGLAIEGRDNDPIIGDDTWWWWQESAGASIDASIMGKAKLVAAPNLTINIPMLDAGITPVIDGTPDNFWRFYDRVFSGVGAFRGDDLVEGNLYDPRIKMAWSADALYVYIEVKDDDVDEAIGWVAGDFIGFGFDFKNDKDNEEFADDGMIFLNAGADASTLSGISRSGQNFGGAWEPPAGTEYASTVVADGDNYRVYHELKFPLWDGLDPLMLGGDFGFTIEVRDSDPVIGNDAWWTWSDWGSIIDAAGMGTATLDTSTFPKVEIEELSTNIVPLIDGTADEFWDEYEPIIGDELLRGNEFAASNVFERTLKMAWAEDAIYILYEVLDDDVDPAIAWAGGDYSAFGFDFNHDGDNAGFSDDGMFFMHPGAEASTVAGIRSGQDFGGDWVAQAGFEYKSTITAEGENFRIVHEAKFPLWEGVPALNEGKTIGFAHTGRDSDPVIGDDTYWIWSDWGSEIDAAGMGDATLVEGPDIVLSVEGEEFQENILVYPNPTKDYLNISYKQWNSAQIVRLDGTVIRNYKNVDMLDIRGLNDGIYVLRIDNVRSVKFIVKN